MRQTWRTSNKWESRVRPVRDAVVHIRHLGVELIAELIHQNGSARPVEIAERLGVTQPTVSKNLTRLKREGFIVQEPYRSIRLTDAGRRLAEACRKRHRIVVEFLIALGISKDVAEHDAEGIEHHVSEETLRVFKDFSQSKMSR